MKHNRSIVITAGSLGMLLLIIDSKTALSGAGAGIELCLKTVVPTLFPFFVLSAMLTSALAGITSRLFTPLGQLLKLPKGAESVFLAGILGGYPLGAKSISTLCKSGQLHSGDGARMMAFCSNAGPAFIFGIAGPMFSQAWVPWLLWVVHILGACITAMLLPRATAKCAAAPGTLLKLPDALSSAIRSLATVCGWVVLFRTVIAFLDRWVFWILPKPAGILAAGLLELSNGCCALPGIANEGLRMVFCSAFLAFGGLCVLMQTLSLAADVSPRLYLPGKLTQTFLCLTLTCLAQWLLPVTDRVYHLPDLLLVFSALTVLSAVFLRKMQKSCSIFQYAGV